MDSWNHHPAVVAGRLLFAWMLPLAFLPLMIWFERKVSAFMQDRTGPNRAAIFGIRLGGVIHTLADVLKLLAKEDVQPSQVHGLYYKLGPFVAIFVAHPVGTRFQFSAFCRTRSRSRQNRRLSNACRKGIPPCSLKLPPNTNTALPKPYAKAKPPTACRKSA